MGGHVPRSGVCRRKGRQRPGGTIPLEHSGYPEVAQGGAFGPGLEPLCPDPVPCSVFMEPVLTQELGYSGASLEWDSLGQQAEALEMNPGSSRKPVPPSEQGAML